MTDAHNAQVPDSTWSVFNSDSSVFYVGHTDGTNHLYNLNKGKFSISLKGTVEDGANVTVNVSSGSWSSTNPNILYAIGHKLTGTAPSTYLYRIDISQSGANRFGGVNGINICPTTPPAPTALGCIIDLAGVMTGGTDGFAELAMSENEDVFSFRTAPADILATKVRVWSWSTNSMVEFPAPANTIIHRDSISKSAHANPSGQGYVYVYFKGSSNYFWPFPYGAILGNTPTDFGHYDLGRSFFVAVSQGAAGVNLTNYGSWTTPSSILAFVDNADKPLCNLNNGVQYPCWAIDASLRNHDEVAALVSTYTGIGYFAGGCTTDSQCNPNGAFVSAQCISGYCVQKPDGYKYPFNNELVLTFTGNPIDGLSQTFVRFANTRTDITDSLPDDYHQPHASIDRLARYVAFTSDMRSEVGFPAAATQTDVYLVAIPGPAFPFVARYNTGSWDRLFHLDKAGNLLLGQWNTSLHRYLWSAVSAPATGVFLTGGLARVTNASVLNDSVWGVGSDGHPYMRYSSTGAESWSWWDAYASISGGTCLAAGNPSATTSGVAGNYIAVTFRCQSGHAGVVRYGGSRAGWTYTDLGTPTGTSLSDDSDVGVTEDATNGFAAYGRMSDGNVWKSNGSSWTNLGNPSTGSLVSSPAAAIDPSSSSPIVVVVDENGKTFVKKGTGSWTQLTSGMQDVDSGYSLLAADSTNPSGQGVFGFARMKSGDGLVRINYRDSTSSWVNDNSTYQQSGYPGNMPVSRPTANVVPIGSGMNSLSAFFETSAAEQIEWTQDTGGFYSFTDDSKLSVP